ncbi:MAG: hypothetical protein U0X20_00065 [Caldilineaceae bacterium]
MSPNSVESSGSSITSETLLLSSGLPVELFGHVTLVQGYAVPMYVGCHALVDLRDVPGTTVAVMTVAPHLQSLLETALATGNLVAFRGQELSEPPAPLGGTWSVPVYSIDGVILYDMA